MIVTFLFTDLVGSTRQWEEHPEVMAAAVARHDGIVREAVEGGGGRVFSTGGDASCAAFDRPALAVGAAVAIQRGVAGEAWPEPIEMAVRVGLHSGEAEARDGDWFGPPLNRVARLMATAHGGQVVVSARTAALVADDLPEDVDLVDLGEHHLKDLARPEHVHQLRIRGLVSVFPPLRSRDRDDDRHNLPARLDGFVGRDDERRAILRALTHHPVVTLVGPGGAGKTRLSLEVARGLVGEYGDGVWQVPLGVATAGDQVATLTAQALGLAVRPDEEPVAALAEHNAGRDLVLVLDNCEHVIDPVRTMVRALVERDPTVRVLATSREPLRCPGEEVVPVPPLAVVAPGSASPAAELFADRAATAAPGFALDAGNAEMVDAVCARLDGLPLAIELAAARLRVISLAELATRLDDRFAVLGGSVDDAPERHQTLEVALAWSYDLLDPAEQQLFRFLSAFPDEAPLAAVEAMAARLDIDALTVLEGLIERSLVTTVRSGPQYRYRLLGSLRDYGRIRLAERGEVDLASRAMRDWVMALVADLERDMRTPRQDDALRAVLPELATARAAYEWTLQQGDPLTALRMLSAVPLMPTGQRFAELGRLLAAIPDAPPALVAQGQLTLANLAGEVGDAEVGVEQAAAAASAFDELGDRRLGAWARYFGAMVAWTGGEERAEVATGLRAALATFEALDDQLGLAYVLWPLSLLDGGAQARDAAERSADLFRRQGSPFGLAHALEGRALVGLVEDRPAEAIAPLEEALTLLAALGNRGCVAHALEAAAAVVAGRGRLDAARLMGAAASLRSEVGQDHRPWEREGLRRTEAALRDGGADPVAVDLAIADGRDLTLAEAVDLAHGALARFREEQETTGSVYADLGLSAREDEVLGLLVEGATNQEIAGRLYLSPKTVERHLSNLYRKLGVANRTQAAAVALRHGRREGED